MHTTKENIYVCWQSHSSGSIGTHIFVDLKYSYCHVCEHGKGKTLGWIIFGQE